MTRWEHVNCCKTIGCSLFGVAQSPAWQAAGLNCRCPECGFLFPLISTMALDAYSQQTNRHYSGVMLCCPVCGPKGMLVRHGKSVSQRQRWHCRTCHRSFTHYAGPVVYDSRLLALRDAIADGALLRSVEGRSQVMGRELSRLAFWAGVEQVHSQRVSLDAEFSTVTFRVPFNGSESLLYVIVTAENKTGRVIALSTNYVASREGIPAEWMYFCAPSEKISAQGVVRRIFDKDRTIARRPLYYDISYGPARLKRNDGGAIVKPVLAAYRHFDLVYALTHDRVLSVQHWLEHECFLYGGCLMANRNEVVKQSTRMGFVHEIGTRDVSRRLRSETILSDIIWRDTWHCYSQRGYELAVCYLTGEQGQSSFRHAILKPAGVFQSWLYVHPIWSQLTRLAPRNVVWLLEYLAAEYNRE